MKHLDLEAPYRARFHGKGAKWRMCPLWESTVKAIQLMLANRVDLQPDSTVFVNRRNQPLTRFSIYYLTREYGRRVAPALRSVNPKGLSPHVLRHSTAVHLLQAGVEVNVIRGWLGHNSLETTNRFAEINMRTKEKALQACNLESTSNEGSRASARWKKDAELLQWLQSL